MSLPNFYYERIIQGFYIPRFFWQKGTIKKGGADLSAPSAVLKILCLIFFILCTIYHIIISLLVRFILKIDFFVCLELVYQCF